MKKKLGGKIYETYQTMDRSVICMFLLFGSIHFGNELYDGL